ncbi:class I SAM-dependent methyltransferase, partial [Rhodoplanes roseus]
MPHRRRPGLPGGLPQRAREALARCADGSLPPAVALTWLAMAGLAVQEASEAVAIASDRMVTARGLRHAERLRHAARLLDEMPDAFDRIAAVLATHDDPPAGTDAVTHWAAVFDRACSQSPEASVALYSLGRPALLDAVTDEIVAWLSARGLLGPERTVLDLGCGIGRFLTALSGRVRLVVGVDVSAVMTETARRRTRGLADTAVVRTGGRDLACMAPAAVDLVLAVDSFPYLVQAGVAARHLEDIHHVLRPGGTLAVLNWSYGGDAAADRQAVEAEAARLG